MLFKKNLLFVLAQTAAAWAFAQNMSTPYSVYGIGDIDHRCYNFNSGMGYTGIALRTGLFTYGNNTASAAGLQKSFLMVDVSTAGKAVTYHGDAIDADNRSNQDFTIKKLSLTAKMNAFWASGIGMKQFSSVGYKFQSTKPIEGTNEKYVIDYSGDGGLNEYYWNNAFNIGRHLSAGVTASFIAGPVNQTETLADNAGSTIESTRRDYYANGRLEYGLIYTGHLAKNWEASAGARFSNQTKMNYERSLSVSENSTAIIEEEFLKYSNFSLPHSFGGGLALANKKGTTALAADYTYEDWSSLGIHGAGWKLVSSSRVSAGAEFASFESTWNKNIRKRSFQVGAFLNNSYLMVGGRQIMEWGVTTGLNRTLKSGLVVGASLEGGIRGTTQANLVQENYFQLTLNFSYRDFIFSKGHRYN